MTAKVYLFRESEIKRTGLSCHTSLTNIGYYMSETGLSLYTADTSPQESTHSGRTRRCSTFCPCTSSADLASN